jgi:dTDP-4-dehydrorhamnose 3,5-epimerase
MKVQQTLLPGVVVVEPAVFSDARGYFFELWRAQSFEKHGLPTRFVQDNISHSHKGVLRGLHFQNPDPQGKLISVLEGEVFDVAVDIRRGSPTFRKWFGTVLTADNHRQLYVPEGFAHGFCALSDSAIVLYKCTAFYNPKTEACLRWDDPEIGVVWPVAQPVLSDKDRQGLSLSQFGERLPEYQPPLRA